MLSGNAWKWAVGLGVLIAYMDSRPSWDDTGVTAAAIFAASLVLGALAPERPWALAIAVGIWVPVWGLAVTQEPATLLALLVAFAGAYAGMAFRRFSSAAFAP